MFSRPHEKFRLVPAPSKKPDAVTYSFLSKAYHCNLCLESKNYESDTEVEEHKAISHRSDIQRLVAKNKNICWMCLKKTDSKTSLLKHFKVAHLLCNPDETQIHREIYACDACNRIYFSKLMLTYHIMNVHKNRTRYMQCPKCEVTMCYQSSYVHFHGHCMQSVSTCPICFIKFDRRKEMLKHVQSHHPCSYKCGLCQYETKKHDNLVFHKAKMHESKTVDTDSKNLEKMAARCFIKSTTSEIESAKFNYLAPLATRGVSLYGVTNLCVLCREICPDEKEMLQHFATAHTNAQTKIKKKYICACGEEFFNSVLLKHHVFKMKEPHRVIKEGEVVETMEDPDVQVSVDWLTEGSKVGSGDEMEAKGQEVTGVGSVGVVGNEMEIKGGEVTGLGSLGVGGDEREARGVENTGVVSVGVAWDEREAKVREDTGVGIGEVVGDEMEVKGDEVDNETGGVKAKLGVEDDVDVRKEDRNDEGPDLVVTGVEMTEVVVSKKPESVVVGDGERELLG